MRAGRSRGGAPPDGDIRARKGYDSRVAPLGGELVLSAEVEGAMPEPIQLNDEDVAFLLTLLRNSSQPMTTQQLIDALRRHGQDR